MKRGGCSGIAVKSIRLVVGKNLVQFVASQSRDRSDEQGKRSVPTTLAVPSQVTWAGTGQLIGVRQLARSHVAGTAQGRNCIVVDADRVSEPLVLRGWQPGDRFYPLGMKGRSKKLQDYFTDLKVPIAVRRCIPVVTAPDGIVWVVGYRQDERWAPTAATERCLVMTASESTTREGV
jgi:tRNA(Ile)-lysidine synthase